MNGSASQKSYKFRASLLGHSNDVRSVSCPSDHLVLSGSRDFTARTWRLSTDSPHGVAELVLRGHDNYVSSTAAYADSSDTVYLFTGSHDKNIRAYSTTDTEPAYVLQGHSENVCALFADPSGLLVSGSWDKSIKLWRNKQCMLTILGHESAVWCILLLSSKTPTGSAVSDQYSLVSGSADHTLKVWSIGHAHSDEPEHKLLKTLMGHTDCVRSLAQLDHDHIVSGSNDASIRAWNLPSGRCVGEFYAHTSFVYSVATRPNASVFVSSGEDRCVRVWPVPRSDELLPGAQFASIQCIPLPCQSVWCVTLTPRLDIVAGCSDSSIRLFSRDPSRQASAEDTKAYESELANAKISTPDLAATGDLDLKKLPGVEALTRPGKREGQVIVIQQDGRQVCYQWSASDARWMEIGDVLGTGQSKLPIYNGKEYDFVFSVDISDDTSHLKLPYNRTEDPWVVAQRFIHEHDLPQDYLETIAKFIIQNAGPPVNPPAPADVPCDPFTGADRYIPSSMYALPESSTSESKHFPSTVFIPLKTISLDPLLAKLETFNKSQSPANQFSPEQFNLLRTFSFDLPNEGAFKLTSLLIEKLASWPTENVFPLLDLLRCLVFWPSACDLIFSDPNWKTVHACSLGNAELPPANCLLTLRLLGNVLASVGQSCLNSNHGLPKSMATTISVIRELEHLLQHPSVTIAERKPLQVALATYLHNLVAFSYLASSSPPEILDTLAGSIPYMSVLPSLCIRLCIAVLSLAAEKGTGALVSFHPDAIHTFFLTVGTALLLATQHLTDPDAIKTHRVELVASAVAGSQTNSVEEVIANWDKVRLVFDYWANTPACPPKVRCSATALLRLLE